MLTLFLLPGFRDGFHENRHASSGESLVYHVTEYRITDGILYRQSAGTWRVILKVAL